MSTPPKEPKPDELRRGGATSLESTYLGVAPIAPEQPVGAAGAAPGAAAAGSAGSAIVATPMISVSDRNKRGDAAPAQPASPPQPASPQAASPQPVSPQGVSPQPAPPVGSPPAAVAAPARPSGLQGGWQSAGIPRALGPEQTALHGSPAWPMPPVAPPAGPRQQPAAAPPRPTPQAPARAATPSPGAVGGLQHTALASDYLRGARDVALGAEAAPAQRPAPPAQQDAADVGRQTAYSPVAAPAPQRAHWQDAPAPQVASGDLNATAASGGPASPPPASPPPTMGPPPTAELSSPAPLPFQTASHAPVQVVYAEPERERGPSPRSMGTQASVAPPPGELAASFHGPMAAAVQDAAPAAVRGAAGPAPMAAVASPVRNAVPQALVGTMLDRTPSVPGKELPHGSPPPPANPTLRFEQVPAPRSSLAQQATSFGLNIPIEHNNTTQWGRPAHDGKTKALPGRRAKGRSQWRMISLAALALVSVVFAAFGPELRDFALAELERRRAAASGRSGPALASADQATQTTLTNLPSPAAAVPAVPAAGGAEAAAPAASAAASAAVVSPPSAATGGLTPPAAAVVAGAEGDTTAMPAVDATREAEPEPPVGKRKRGAKGREAKALAEADAEAAVSPESKLAAEAGRHVLAARFADALPLYRTLQRDYPQNTAYAAMTKVLEQKLSGAGQNGAQP